MKLAYPMSSDDYLGDLMAFSKEYETVFPILKKSRYDGIELLIRDPEVVDTDRLDHFLSEYGMQIAAIGTTPMQKEDKLFLMSGDEAVRRKARERCSRLIRLCSKYHAGLLLGKYRGMIHTEQQGCTWDDLMSITQDICREAAEYGVQVIIEPQNSTNINNINTIDDALDWIRKSGQKNLSILADIYHMDITEQSVYESIKRAGGHIGFIHMSDSERKVPGSGKIDIKMVLKALREIDYDGFISFEIKQNPDSASAVQKCADSIRELLA